MEPAEIVSEEAIEAWASSRRSAVNALGAGHPENRFFEQPKTQEFLEWLAEEEEE